MKGLDLSLYSRLFLLLLCVNGSACRCALVRLPENWNDQELERVGSPPTLAVLPFLSMESGGDPSLRIGDILTTTLFKTGRFKLVERAKLNEILKEQRFGGSKLADQDTAITIGKLTAARAVIFGVQSKATQQKFDNFAFDVWRTEVRIDARAVDTQTGRLILAESAEGVSEEKVITDANGKVISGIVDLKAEFPKAAADAAVQLAKKLGRQFPLVGYVISVDNDRVITDLGSSKEVEVGDQLVLLRPLKRLLHPLSGAPVAWLKQILCLAEVGTVEHASSTAEILCRKHPEDSARAGDVVVLQPSTGRNAVRTTSRDQR